MSYFRFVPYLLSLVAFGVPVVAFAADQPLPGKKLLLKSAPGKPQKQLLKLVAKSADVTIGDGEGSADDPTVHGGTLHVAGAGAAPFADAFPLPAASWRRLGKEGAGKGYKLKSAGPIRTIVVKTGKLLKVIAKGEDLGHALDTSPEPIDVVLEIGGQRLCLSFSGSGTLKPGKKFVSTNAPAPASCAQPPTTTTTIVGGTTTSTTPGSSTTTLVTTTSSSTTTSTTLYASFADAPPEVLQRLDEVLAAARAVLNGGGTFADVIDLLTMEPDVTNVFVDGLTLEFTVAGLESALHDGQAARLGTPVPAATSSRRLPSTAAASTPIPVVEAAGMPPVGQRMVGADRDLDGRRDVAKKAIVLSPYKFQFQATDDGQPITDILKARADYAGGVDYHEIATKGAAILSLDLWTSWLSYDVIHIVTHGDRNRLWLGDSTSSCTTLAATIRSQLPTAADRTGLRCGSVNTAPANAAPTWDTDVSVDPSFFAWHYPAGLPKRFVFLNACRTSFAPGMAQSLLGDDTIYLGWDEYVDSQLALDTAVALYQDMIGLGFPAWRSFLRTCTGGKCINMRASLPSGQTKNEELEIAYDRADLRLRESLAVFPPFQTGVCLEVPDVPLEFSCPSCVNPDFGVFVGYDVTIDGFVPEDLALRTDPFEFAIEQLRVFADADDVDTGYALPLISDNNPQLMDLGDGKWQSPVTLYVPNVCPGDVVSYLPKLMLPAYDPNAGGLRDFSYPTDGPWDLTFDTPPF